MKRKALDYFESSSRQLLKLAMELSTTKEKEEGVAHSAIRRLRCELIVMLDVILKSLSWVFKL
jgi:hypothetical protein